jgi:3D (Asp-Asp-Asp) domain-containing protein
VDPKVIPLGTRLFIPGYGYGIAADTGGVIDGNRIDLCYETRAEAMLWGRRTVTITILQ